MGDQVTKNAKSNRLCKIVMVCSLALNLAIVGFVGGALVSGRAGDGPPRHFDLGVGPIARALTPDERRAIGRNLRQAQNLRDVDLRARASAMLQALQADPFDPEALRALLTAQVAAMGQVQIGAQDALLAEISAMTPARRAEFAAAVAQEFRRQRAPRAPGSGG